MNRERKFTYLLTKILRFISSSNICDGGAVRLDPTSLSIIAYDVLYLPTK